MDQHDDNELIRALANGGGGALEPLMERWGDPVMDTCFRAVRDGRKAYDLYGEVFAEAYKRLRFETGRTPESFGVWTVEIIGDLVAIAAREGRVPVQARVRMHLPRTEPTRAEIERIESLREPTTLREAREELPRDFSAAADRMLLRVPEPNALNRIQLSMPWSST